MTIMRRKIPLILVAQDLSKAFMNLFFQDKNIERNRKIKRPACRKKLSAIEAAVGDGTAGKVVEVI